MKKAFTTFSILVVLAMIAISVNYAIAAFSLPGTTPVGQNRSSVITAGETQVKTGDLSVNTFSASGYSYFGQDVFFQKQVRGALSGASTVQLGGTDSFGVKWNTNAIIQGNLNTAGEFRSPVLSNGTEKKICSDTTGKIVLCN